MQKYPPIHYSDYLQLDKFLDCQKRRSEEFGKPAHDEMLFVIVHQSYELWFKQIIFEMDAVLELFSQENVPEKNIGQATSHLKRIIEIQKILIDQFRILETMTSADFLDFRDFLVPASGFQSAQFRIIESKMGAHQGRSQTIKQAPCYTRLEKASREALEKSLEGFSLLSLVERWLERTPFLTFGDFDFWSEYRGALRRMLKQDQEIVMTNPVLSEEEKKAQVRNLEATENKFLSIFDEELYNKMIKEGSRHISFNAFKAAVFINLYREQPILQTPFSFIGCLIEIDQLFTMWRYRHAIVVSRMIGTKIGTGGSSGHKYLLANAEKQRVFQDFSNISTFLIPRSALPKLTPEIEQHLGYYFNYS